LSKNANNYLLNVHAWYKKTYVMSLAKTKQNNKIKKSKVGQEIPHFLIFRPRH